MGEFVDRKVYMFAHVRAYVRACVRTKCVRT